MRAFLGRDEKGRPKQVSRIFRGGKRAAGKALAELDVSAASGKHGRPGGSDTIDDLLTLHFDHLDRRGLSPKTVDNYRRYARNIMRPALRLQEDQVPHGPGSRSPLRPAQGPGETTCDDPHGPRHHVRSAWTGGQVGHGQRQRRSIASPPAVHRARIAVPTATQVRAILTSAEERSPILGRMLMLAALTGARRGEVCALRWCDVDLRTGTLTIAHSILDLPGRVELKDTKSHAVRVLALDPAATAVLNLHRADVDHRAAAVETVVRPDGFVFSTDSFDGSAVVRPDRLTAFFNRVRDGLGAGCEGLTLHGLRRFVATQLAARGDISTRTLAGRLGHADASVTMHVYADFFPAADLHAAADMGRVLTEAN